MICHSGTCTFAVILGLMLLIGFQTMSAAQTASGPAVTVSEDDAGYTLANGIVTAKVSKANGELTSLQYKGMETLSTQQGRIIPAEFNQNAAGGTGVAAKVTIDPKTNNGDRAEVSVKGLNCRGVGSDIDFRFSMGKGESGIYFYAVFDHPADYPAASFSESRWVARLADDFDTMPIDKGIMRQVPPDLNGHQLLFTASYFEQRAYGWASSKKNVGFWMINASTEYVGGGATKTDFLNHRDNPPPAADFYPPCVLLFWKASHFGGGTVPLGAGEKWSKVVGPMFLYCNSGPDPMTMWKDAEALAVKQEAKWPYDWVKDVDYVQRDGRASVKGQVVLSDPLMPGAKMSNVLVGLAHPAYAPPAGRGGRRGGGGGQARLVDWESDAKYYQFWTHGEDNGNFSIANVIPGTYTLHAIADGVLGEFEKADITVEAGKPIDLGKLTWTPVRYGKQIWEIGIPNRNAREFTGGDTFYDPRGPLRYPELFPNDVNFQIGKSDTHKDWFYEHVPHLEGTGELAGNQGVTGSGRATPYNIHFDMPAASKGKATLRLAICGTQGRSIEVAVNDKPAGQVALGGSDLVITRHGMTGTWYERELAFDAALLKQGANVLTLTIPAGRVNDGVVYDYLRLELDENAQAPAAQ